MKKFLSICACAILVFCFFSSAAFATEISNNTISYNRTRSIDESEGSCTIAYSISTDQEDDWNLEMLSNQNEEGLISEGYYANIKPGSTITIRLSCAEDVRATATFRVYDSDWNITGEIAQNNEMGGGADLEINHIVSDDDYGFQIYFGVFPTMNTASYFDGLMANYDFFPYEGAVVSEGTGETENMDADTSKESYVGDFETEDDYIDEESEDEKSGIVPIVATGAGIAAIAAAAVIIKGKAGATAAAKVAETIAEEAVEETRVVTDSATGAQTLYIKDASGQWVSSDGGSVLDTDSLSDWQEQRASDRAWQDASNEGLKKPTTFEDIDRQAALEEEKIRKESYIEQVAVKHAVYGEDIDTIYDKVSHDQANAEVAAEAHLESAEHIGKVIEATENIKTVADYSVSALGAVTGPAGTAVKDLYAAGTTIAGDVAEAVAAGKDKYDIAEAASGAIAKSAISVIQNHATGVVGKSAADIVGGAATGGVDALVKGGDVAQGIATGGVSGAFNAMVDTGSEMVGALKGGSDLSSLGKDLVSSANDVAGDFAKNSGSEAIKESFEKSFKEMKGSE